MSKINLAIDIFQLILLQLLNLLFTQYIRKVIVAFNVTIRPF